MSGIVKNGNCFLHEFFGILVLSTVFLLSTYAFGFIIPLLQKFHGQSELLISSTHVEI